MPPYTSLMQPTKAVIANSDRLTGISLVTKGSVQANIKVAIEWEFNQDKGG
ncbi:MAG: hypothetical protein IM333_03870 [Microcystis sp. M048S1]|uniref:hypothetical protein n=1 Tax=Microcystis TaxID=1125 RepID=UPI0012DA43FA|nr:MULTISPECIES: hypothetical protein [Microcystis]MCA2729140.1 hypothetical protein [Microcystis sp. M162S2]MCA2775353.1 hypothetical protein [Microcystis sp. M135S2]MCA2895856.1 hypothetical protein [Microcystis sp. M039S1]MCA2899964.1 hypothetical protein [Microcystis sp. M035S1]MCA2892135.1 hypothetical protein [Microcystis sp. M048S1]